MRYCEILLLWPAKPTFTKASKGGHAILETKSDTVSCCRQNAVEIFFLKHSERQNMYIAMGLVPIFVSFKSTKSYSYSICPSDGKKDQKLEQIRNELVNYSAKGKTVAVTTVAHWATHTEIIPGVGFFAWSDNQ